MQTNIQEISVLNIDIVSGGYETNAKLLAKQLKPRPERQYSWGSGPGEWHYRQTKNGQRENWYTKFGRKDENTMGDDQLRAEFIAQRIYRHLGFSVPETHLIKLNGQLAVAKKELQGLDVRPNLYQLAEQEQARLGMLVDIYLNNWDITTNFAVASGTVYRVDSGGALDCRARGEWKKFSDFGMFELDNFRSSSVNYNGSILYRGVTEEDLKKSAALITSLTNEDLGALVKAAEYADKRKEVRIASTLIRRREEIKSKIGTASKEQLVSVPAEVNNWNTVEALRPVDREVSRVVEKIGEFERSVLTPWIESIDLVEQKIASLKNLDPKGVALEAKYTSLVDRISKNLSSARGVDNLIKIGQNPHIAIGGKPSLGESLKWHLSHSHREKRIAEARLWSQNRLKESQILFSQGFEELKATVISGVTTIVNEKNYQQTLRAGEANVLARGPQVITSVSESIRSTQDKLKLLKQFNQRVSSGSIDSQKAIQELEEKIKKEIVQLETFRDKQLASTIRASVVLCEEVSKTLGAKVNLPLAEFVVVPTSMQEGQISNYCARAKQFAISQKDGLTKSGINMEQFDRTINYVKGRRERFRARCEKIRKDKVSHMTRTEDKYAKQIFRDGFLISSLGQQKLRKEANVNSPAGKEELLPEITFAVNAAELSYGAKEVDDAAKREEHLGVGFVFPYALAAEEAQFFEQGSSQASPYNELHVFHLEYDGSYRRQDWEHAVVKLDVNKGFFIAPEAKRVHWLKFLSTPIEKGGAGKNEEWINEHVRFYPEYASADEFIQYSESFGWSMPKSDTGVLVPTGKIGIVGGSYEKAPLFKWVTFSNK